VPKINAQAVKNINFELNSYFTPVNKLIFGFKWQYRLNKICYFPEPKIIILGYDYIVS